MVVQRAAGGYNLYIIAWIFVGGAAEEKMESSGGSTEKNGTLFSGLACFLKGPCVPCFRVTMLEIQSGGFLSKFRFYFLEEV